MQVSYMIINKIYTIPAFSDFCLHSFNNYHDSMFWDSIRNNIEPATKMNRNS